MIGDSGFQARRLVVVGLDIAEGCCLIIILLEETHTCGSFQQSGVPIQMPNSRALITRTPTNGPRIIYRNSHVWKHSQPQLLQGTQPRFLSRKNLPSSELCCKPWDLQSEPTFVGSNPKRKTCLGSLNMEPSQAKVEHQILALRPRAS